MMLYLSFRSPIPMYGSALQIASHRNGHIVCSRHFASLAPATTLRLHHPPISRTGKSAEATPEVVVCF